MARDDDDDSEEMEEFNDELAGLVEVGGLTEVGARRLRKAAKKVGKAKPSPTFARSTRSTTRRAPLGFSEDGTGALFWSLAAAIGATTIMRAKVSRKAHVDRLLIVPSAPGVVLASIKVGDVEQLLAPGCPVELYSASALTDTLPDNFDPLSEALDFTVTLQNTTAGAITGTIGTKAECER